MSTKTIWLLVTILLSALTGMKFSDLMNYEIDKQRREALSLQRDIVATKEETIEALRGTRDKCIDIVIKCETQLLDVHTGGVCMESSL